MIIKNPAPRGSAAQLADYLLHEKKNERAELLELRGWNMPTLKGAFNMTEEIAHSKTRCENPFYHVSFRAAPGETLTPEQWQICADKLEKKLGLDGHHRALVLHTYKGENHLHVVWDRIDEQTLIAANLWQDHTKSNEVARQLERELGLKQVPEKSHDREQEPDPPTMAEEQQARRKGQDLKDLRQSIRDAWQQSDSGKSFKAALEEKGFSLAQGDRRDYVAIDPQGSVYSIGKRTTGATAQQVRDRLEDLDRENLPTVEQARDKLAAQKLAKELEQRQEKERLELEQQQEQERLELEQQQEQQRQEEAQAHDRESIKEAWTKTQTASAFAKSLSDKGFILAAAHQDTFVAINPAGNCYSLDRDSTGAEAPAIQSRMGYGIHYEKMQLPTIEQARATQAERQQAHDREAWIERARSEVAAENDPVMQFLKRQAEYKAEILKRQAQEREALEKQIKEREAQGKAWAKATEERITEDLKIKHYYEREGLKRRLHEYHATLGTQAKRHTQLFLRQKIEEIQAERRKEKLREAVAKNEQRQTTQANQRLSRQEDAHKRQTAKIDIKHAEWRQQRGIDAPDRDAEARDAQKTLVKSDFKRAARKTTEPEKPHENDDKKQAQKKGKDWLAFAKERLGGRRSDKPKECPASREISLDGGLKVLDRATGISSSLKGVAGGIFRLLTTGRSQPPEPTPEERRANLVALRHIRDSLERGQDLDLADVQSLSPTHLKRIMEQGDDYLKNLVREEERRRRERDRER